MLLKVLYLDDEEDLCEIFMDLFSGNQFEIITFSNPVEAIEYLKNNEVDLIFLDYRLPGTNGDKVAQMIGGNTPKYLVTGEIVVECKYPYLQILKKPLEVSVIKNILKVRL